MTPPCDPVICPRLLTTWPLRCSEVLLVSAAMVMMALHIVIVSGDANMYGSSINTYILRVREADCGWATLSVWMSSVLWWHLDCALRRLPPASRRPPSAHWQHVRLRAVSSRCQSARPSSVHWQRVRLRTVSSQCHSVSPPSAH